MNTTPTRSPDRPEPAPPGAALPLRTALVIALVVALASGLVASAATLGVARHLGSDTRAAEPAPAAGPRSNEGVADESSGEGGSLETDRATNAERKLGANGGVDEEAVAVGELETLREALDTAEAERSQLAGILLALNRRVETLETRPAALADASPGEAGEQGALPSGADGEIIVAGEPDDTLVAAGLDPQSAAEIRRRRDAFQLARLELADQAAREGWFESERFDERLEELEQSRPDLREELGDDLYDRYLFEEGDNNRVGIAQIIAGSQASEAGLVPGDLVLSYAGERVFRMRDLQAATRQGQRGESVQLVVLRDGELVAVDAQRGPLGVTLEGQRLPPD